MWLILDYNYLTDDSLNSLKNQNQLEDLRMKHNSLKLHNTEFPELESLIDL